MRGTYALLLLLGIGCTELERAAQSSPVTGADGSTPSADQDAATGDQGPMAVPQPADCHPPFCGWTSEGDDACVSAGLPGPELRPAVADTSTTEVAPFYLALSQLSLETGTAGDAFGFDLDGQCTGIDGCVASASCKQGSASALPDGAFCADNTYARMLAEAVDASPAAHALGFSDASINCGLHRGRYNHVLRIAGYNGTPQDDRVRIDFYTSTGLEDVTGRVDCEAVAEAPDQPVTWNASDRFSILENDLSSPMSTAAGLPNSKISVTDAFVRDGVLMAFVPSGYSLKLVPGDPSASTVQLDLQRMTLVGQLKSDGAGGYKIEDGAIAGRQAIADVLRAFGQVGVCEQGDFADLRQALDQYLSNYADVALDEDSSGDMACDSVSTALRFAARGMTPGRVETERQVLNCCLPQNYGVGGCPIMRCGDGTVADDEHCDIGIPAGQPGSCPVACKSTDPCKKVSLEGKGCQAHCAVTPVETPRDGDGCCPDKATSANDDDCNVKCGDGVIEAEAGETCDPPGSCPVASDCGGQPQVCTEIRYVGAPETCDARCAESEITSCVSGDGCCPSNCDAQSDSDCSTTCGDGQVDAPQETCDGDCPTSCAPPAGAQCKAAMLVGSAAQCSAQCVMWDITSCRDNDGCCPSNCNGANDADCTAMCGNGIVEGVEECDDSNQATGDGCSGCMLETQDRMCRSVIANAPARPECLACTCDKCAAEVVNCTARGTSEERRLCQDVAFCRLRTWCEFLDCYVSNGPCMSEVEAAGMSTNLFTLLERAVDPLHPFGRASDVETCTRTECQAECAP